MSFARRRHLSFFRPTGLLYPAAQLVIDKEGKLQFQLSQNAWNLVDVIDWKGTQGVN
jgi:hypothetical protein